MQLLGTEWHVEPHVILHVMLSIENTRKGPTKEQSPEHASTPHRHHRLFGEVNCGTVAIAWNHKAAHSPHSPCCTPGALFSFTTRFCICLSRFGAGKAPSQSILSWFAVSEKRWPHEFGVVILEYISVRGRAFASAKTALATCGFRSFEHHREVCLLAESRIRGDDVAFHNNGASGRSAHHRRRRQSAGEVA